MIEKMKKIILVSLQKDQKDALTQLRELGVMHVEPSNVEKSGEYLEIVANKEKIHHAIDILSNLKVAESENSKDYEKLSPIDLADAVSKAHLNIEWLNENIANHNRIYDDLLPWGEFSSDLYAKLTKKGFDIRFCVSTQIPELPENSCCEEITRIGKDIYFVIISQTAITIELPEVNVHTDDSLSDIKRRNTESEKAILENKKNLEKLAFFRNKLETESISLAEKQEFKSNIDGMGLAKQLAYIIGYVPEKETQKIIDASSLNGWALKIDEPDDDDLNVPTYITIPKWLNVSKPLFEFVGITPGYKEFDISAWFLIFFSIFFAIIVGDAGYGSLFLIATIIAKMKAPKSLQVTLNLVLILSVSTVIWGALTGNYFGTSPSFLPSGLDYLTDPKDGQKHTQALCLLIGAIHLSIAHLWRFSLVINKLVCLSQLGWFCMIWGNYMLGSSLVTGGPLPFLTKYAYIAGAIMILLFSNPSKNILKVIGGGLGQLLGGGVNSFVDVLSYIRLFAVGLAGYYVAKSFNGMGMGFVEGATGAGLIVKFCIAVGIIVFGHLLNIALCGLGVLVHGIRLNTLEFSGHMGLEWTGVLFKPFKRKLRQAEGA